MNDWHTRILCGTNPDAWTTPSQRISGGAVTAARHAIAVCHACPVLAECGLDAQAHPPIGLIQAGVPYSDAGTPMGRCENDGCRRFILGRGTNARFCGQGCEEAVRARTKAMAVAA